MGLPPGFRMCVLSVFQIFRFPATRLTPSAIFYYLLLTGLFEVGFLLGRSCEIRCEDPGAEPLSLAVPNHRNSWGL